MTDKPFDFNKWPDSPVNPPVIDYNEDEGFFDGSSPPTTTNEWIERRNSSLWKHREPVPDVPDDFADDPFPATTTDKSIHPSDFPCSYVKNTGQSRPPATTSKAIIHIDFSKGQYRNPQPDFTDEGFFEASERHPVHYYIPSTSLLSASDYASHSRRKKFNDSVPTFPLISRLSPFRFRGRIRRSVKSFPRKRRRPPTLKEAQLIRRQNRIKIRNHFLRLKGLLRREKNRENGYWYKTREKGQKWGRLKIRNHLTEAKGPGMYINGKAHKVSPALRKKQKRRRRDKTKKRMFPETPEKVTKRELEELVHQESKALNAWVLIENMDSLAPPLHEKEARVFRMMYDPNPKKNISVLPTGHRPPNYLFKYKSRLELILNDFRATHDLSSEAVRIAWLYGFEGHRSFDWCYTTVRFYFTLFYLKDIQGGKLSEFQKSYVRAVIEANQGNPAFPPQFLKPKDPIAVGEPEDTLWRYRFRCIEIWLGFNPEERKEPDNDIHPLSDHQIHKALQILHDLDHFDYIKVPPQELFCLIARGWKIAHQARLAASKQRGSHESTKAVTRKTVDLRLAEKGRIVCLESSAGIKWAPMEAYKKLPQEVDKEDDHKVNDWSVANCFRLTKGYDLEFVTFRNEQLESGRAHVEIYDNPRIKELQNELEMNDVEFAALYTNAVVAFRMWDMSGNLEEPMCDFEEVPPSPRIRFQVLPRHMDYRKQAGGWNSDRLAPWKRRWWKPAPPK